MLKSSVNVMRLEFGGRVDIESWILKRRFAGRVVFLAIAALLGWLAASGRFKGL